MMNGGSWRRTGHLWAGPLNSLMLVTALNPHIGYENAARIALCAHRENLSLREAAEKLGLLKREDFDRLVDPAAMTKPG